jgi:hypothetical protein
MGFDLARIQLIESHSGEFYCWQREKWKPNSPLEAELSKYWQWLTEICDGTHEGGKLLIGRRDAPEGIQTALYLQDSVMPITFVVSENKAISHENYLILF